MRFSLRAGIIVLADKFRIKWRYALHAPTNNAEEECIVVRRAPLECNKTTRNKLEVNK